MNQPGLSRRLGTSDAVIIGLGSMIGAGVFAAFAPAARAAGGALLLALVLAGLVAFCNATSSAQLAARYPASGGTYVYGRAELGHWWGFAAGWCFVIGKTASCAAMALTFASYAVPWPAWQRPVAIVAVLALAAVNYHGVTRTAGLTRVIVTIVLVVLALAVGLGLSGEGAEPIRLGLGSGPLGVLQAAGLLFFAFAGYARIATMGEVGFSSFGVLLYYAIANASAFKQTQGRRYPRALQLLGLVSCVAIALTLPWQSVGVGVAVLGIGLAGRAVVRNRG